MIQLRSLKLMKLCKFDCAVKLKSPNFQTLSLTSWIASYFGWHSDRTLSHVVAPYFGWHSDRTLSHVVAPYFGWHSDRTLSHVVAPYSGWHSDRTLSHVVAPYSGWHSDRTLSHVVARYFGWHSDTCGWIKFDWVGDFWGGGGICYWNSVFGGINLKKVLNY